MVCGRRRADARARRALVHGWDWAPRATPVKFARGAWTGLFLGAPQLPHARTSQRLHASSLHCCERRCWRDRRPLALAPRDPAASAGQGPRGPGPSDAATIRGCVQQAWRRRRAHATGETFELGPFAIARPMSGARMPSAAQRSRRRFGRGAKASRVRAAARARPVR